MELKIALRSITVLPARSFGSARMQYPTHPFGETMKKQLTAILAVSLGLLSACAVEGDASEEQLDEDMIETTEQAFGEAACGTYTSTDSTDGKSQASFATCFASQNSPDGTYGNALTDPCKRGYYKEVQNITTASTILASANFALDTTEQQDLSDVNCRQYHLRADVYATDTLGATVKVGSMSRDGQWSPIGPSVGLCSVLANDLTFSFPRVQAGRTFVKARIVAQAYRDTGTALIYKKVRAKVDDASSPCP
ncbi:MAG: hypothetical protein EOP08_12675 [Proteobacteria bacterium]|nr:MAG: hypothetical protein EOP08_12675 [Pseudomonadota bacterium]